MKIKTWKRRLARSCFTFGLCLSGCTHWLQCERDREIYIATAAEYARNWLQVAEGKRSQQNSSPSPASTLNGFLKAGRKHRYIRYIDFVKSKSFFQQIAPQRMLKTSILDSKLAYRLEGLKIGPHLWPMLSRHLALSRKFAGAFLDKNSKWWTNVPVKVLGVATLEFEVESVLISSYIRDPSVTIGSNCHKFERKYYQNKKNTSTSTLLGSFQQQKTRKHAVRLSGLPRAELQVWPWTRCPGGNPCDQRSGRDPGSVGFLGIRAPK